MNKKHIIALHAPSWAWKSAVMKFILETYENKWAKLLPNCTTRPRRNEKDNDYKFLDKALFLKKRRKREIIQSTKIETDWKKEYYWFMEPESPLSLISVDEKWLNKLTEYCKRYNQKITKIYLEVEEIERIRRMHFRWDSNELITKRINFDRRHFTEKWIEMCDFRINAYPEIEIVCQNIKRILDLIIK